MTNRDHKFLAIDQGTSSSRAMVFSQSGDVLAVARKELSLSCPCNGWVEQDAEQIWRDVLSCAREVLSAHPDVTTIGITNQRETTVIWDRESGKPVYKAIVWQDRRTADLCAQLRNDGHEEDVSARTGLLLDPYFSATKISWILDHVDGARQKAEDGKLAFGTIDSWLIWNLTGGARHMTDATNASRTMLYNIVRGEWDETQLDLLRIPRTLLPEVLDSVAAFGETDPSLFWKSYPVCGVAGDQQAALIGQGCFESGMVKSTYGTGCFALMNIGDTFHRSQSRLLTSIGYRVGGKTTYVLEGSIFIAGAAVQFLRDNLGFFGVADESEALALSVPDNDGVYFVPALTGLGAPYWNPDARGAIFGLTRDTQRGHLARAALEAQAYQTKDLMDAFLRDTGVVPDVLRVDGGLVTNHFMVQFLSDILNVPVEIPSCRETTALGAAYLAALGSGVFSSLSDISVNWRRSARLDPAMDEDSRDRLYNGWKRHVAALLTIRS